MVNEVSLIKQGDQFIFEEVFMQCHERLYLFILRKTHSSFLAEETVQITFIKLWQGRHRLNEQFSISQQLFRIAATTLIDLLRKETIREKLLPVLKNSQPYFFKNETLENLEAKELNEFLNGAIQRMPPARRMVFKMSRQQGMTYKEIAAVLSLSIKTVENHISLAIKTLRHLQTIFILVIFLPHL